MPVNLARIKPEMRGVTRRTVKLDAKMRIAAVGRLPKVLQRPFVARWPTWRVPAVEHGNGLSELK